MDVKPIGSKPPTTIILTEKRPLSRPTIFAGIYDCRMFMVSSGQPPKFDPSKYDPHKIELTNTLKEKGYSEAELSALGKAFDRMVDFHKDNVDFNSSVGTVLYNIDTARLLLKWGFGPKVLAASFIQDVSRKERKGVDQEVEKMVNDLRALNDLCYSLSDYSDRGVNYAVEMLIMQEGAREVWAIKAANEYHALSVRCENDEQLKSLARHAYSRTARVLMLFNFEEAAIELENLAFFRFDKQAFEESKKKITEANKRSEIEALEELRLHIECIGDALKDAGIKFRAKADIKTPSRAHEKIRKGDKLTDGLRFRIIIDGDQQMCKKAFEIIVWEMNEHRWNEDFEERKNYIKGIDLGKKRDPKYDLGPKEDNSYESIHLNFQGPLGEKVNIQIRNEGMDEKAERGSASHGRYKAGELGMDFGRIESDRERFVRENRRYAMDRNGKLYKLVPHPADRQPTLLDLAFAISAKKGLTCPDFVILRRINPATGLVEQKRASVFEPVQNGDMIIIPTKKENGGPIPKGRKERVATLTARTIIERSSQGKIDKNEESSRSSEVRKSGETLLDLGLRELKESFINALIKILRGEKEDVKMPHRVLYSLERAAKFLGLENEEGLMLAIGLSEPEERARLIADTRRIIEEASAAIAYKINESKIDIWLIVKNLSGVTSNIIEILRKYQIQPVFLTANPAPVSPSTGSFSLIKSRLTTSVKDPEKMLADLMNDLNNMYKGVHLPKAAREKPLRRRLTFSIKKINLDVLSRIFQHISVERNINIRSLSVPPRYGSKPISCSLVLEVPPRIDAKEIHRLVKKLMDERASDIKVMDLI